MEDKSCELIDVTVPKLVLHSRSIRFRFGPLVVGVEVDEVLLECRVGVGAVITEPLLTLSKQVSKQQQYVQVHTTERIATQNACPVYPRDVRSCWKLPLARGSKKEMKSVVDGLLFVEARSSSHSTTFT
jgi:hypothetical protein